MTQLSVSLPSPADSGKLEPNHPVYKIKRMIGRKILGLKCMRPDIKGEDGEVLIEIPSMATGSGITDDLDCGETDRTGALMYRHTKHWTNWVKVVKIGPDCKYFDVSWWQEHDVFMVFPEFGEKFHSLGQGYYVIDEAWLDPEKPALRSRTKPNDPNWRMRQPIPGYVYLIPRSSK